MNKIANIEVGDHFASFIEAQIAQGRYDSAAKVVHAALRLLEEQEAKLAALRSALESYEQVLFGPVFPSISKPGYGPDPDFPWGSLERLLAAPRRGPCRVLAVGGITEERLGRCLELGFDGAALMGAVWNGGDPAAAFRRIRDAAQRLGDSRHAA